MRKSMSERTADLVLGATSVDNDVQFKSIREYRELEDFIASQPHDTDISLNWHYLDKTLRRKLSINCAQSALQLTQHSLEVPRFQVQSYELREANYPIEMSRFTLSASGIFEPDDLYQRYNSLRQHLKAQDAVRQDVQRDLGSLDAPICELRHSSPAA
ncbi:MAG: hypothetical protein UY35_C0020G0002 [Candidatus Saccharibacteria bacterium GW2011_GWC2_48_9]|nr:MAG: hypothetical protein UY35_C0020G0002 [Candidatus Saccharibacteria bacterium GW2011_GWC2_48_9]